MNTKQPLHSHIEEAICIFNKLRSYDVDIYIDAIHVLFNRYGIEAKWQIEGFFKLMKLVIFKDVPLCYTISENKLIVQKTTPKHTGYIKFGDLDIGVKKTFKDAPNSLESLTITIAKALYCSKIAFGSLKEENSDWKKDFRETIKEEDHMKIQCIIQFALFHLESNDLCTFFNEINGLFYYHLIKALLNAEYLLLDNYTELLDEVLKCDINDSSSDQFSVPKVVLPYPIKSFIILALHEKEMCFRIKQIIDKPGTNRIAITLLEDEYANNRLDEKILIGETVTAAIGKFVKSVVDMTMIDHSFKTNDTNFDKLINLLKRLEVVKRLGVTQLNNVLDLVEVKASSMLYSMLIQKQKCFNIQYRFTSGIQHDVDLLPSLREQSGKLNSASDNNIFISKRKLNFGKKVDLTDLKSRILPYTSKGRKDINLYHKCIEIGLDNYELISNIIDSINKQPNDERIINLIEEFYQSHSNSDKLTSSFYIKSFEYIEQYIISLEQDDNIERKNRPILLLTKLLASFRNYILKYEHSVPARYLPIFEFSFYKLESTGLYVHSPISKEYIENYDYHSLKDQFFFASLCCSPLNIQSLLNIYELYANKNHEYSIIYYNQMNRIYISVAKEEIQKDLRNQIGTLGNIVNKYNKKIEEKANKVAEKARKDNEELRHQSMQLLGIFAAFLAFVTISVDASKIATSAIDFLIFSFSYTLGLIVFVFLIKSYKEEEIKEFPRWKKMIYVWEKYALFIILLAGLIFAVCIHFNEKDKLQKEPTLNTVVEEESSKVSHPTWNDFGESNIKQSVPKTKAKNDSLINRK